MAKSRKRRRDDQDPPPPPPKDSDQSKKKRHDSDASASKQPLPVDDVPIPDDVHLSDSKDTGAAYLPKNKTRPDWLKPLPEEEAPKTPEPDWNKTSYFRKQEIWDSSSTGIANKLGSRSSSKLIYQIDLLNPEGNRVVHDISKPLPLEGPPGNKEIRNALSISKLKAAYYPDFGLKELVSSLWIESERDYDISAAYGISHWWFKRKEFYIIRHSAPFNRNAVRSHIRILSVVSLKTFSRYGYTYLQEIVLRRADYKEYKISEVDFKKMHPNDFEDLYLLHLQGKLKHLSRADKSRAVGFHVNHEHGSLIGDAVMITRPPRAHDLPEVFKAPDSDVLALSVDEEGVMVYGIVLMCGDFYECRVDSLAGGGGWGAFGGLGLGVLSCGHEGHYLGRDSLLFPSEVPRPIGRQGSVSLGDGSMASVAASRRWMRDIFRRLHDRRSGVKGLPGQLYHNRARQVGRGMGDGREMGLRYGVGAGLWDVLCSPLPRENMMRVAKKPGSGGGSYLEDRLFVHLSCIVPLVGFYSFLELYCLLAIPYVDSDMFSFIFCAVEWDCAASAF
ncbi:hypothetical protein Tco_0471241 [Tanacetum coccineum]